MIERRPEGDVMASKAVVVRQGNLYQPDSPLRGKVRGERSVMDYPFFALAKQPVQKELHFTIGSASIEIRPSAAGIATMYDKEIILYVASLMAQAKKEGKTVEQDFTFTAHDFFRITGVARPSKRDYDRFTDALERLQGTQIRTNIQTGSKIEKGWFSWLSEATAEYAVLPNGEQGPLRVVQVRLCPWLHRAIEKDGHIYHYHHEYFRLGTIERRLYEIAHCHCDGEAIELPFEILARKVGSTGSAHRFKQHLRSVEADDALPEYKISLRDVLPAETRYDSRGRRIGTPDTMVMFTPRNRQPAAQIETA
ncbi:replication initiator protein A [Sphingomonas bacterium]|uniref:replication initiator protein A n=1 Tax=Sphingomonas bacterium TaxID=1895847 RepID=UPI0020C6270A|nr:replication initiator protein A [Sphingomonas bacterium]